MNRLLRRASDRLLWLLISLAATLICWRAAGNSLGLFIGGLFVASFLTPAAVIIQPDFVRALWAWVAVSAPIAAIWLLAVLQTPDSVLRWLEAALLLMGFSGLLAAMARALAGFRLPGVIASATIVAIGLAWLSWPIWLAPGLVAGGHSKAVQHLAALHPLLAINGILTSQPAWTEQSIAYRLTNLDQDVSIALPRNPAFFLFHITLAMVVVWPLVLLGRKFGPGGRFENQSKAA